MLLLLSYCDRLNRLFLVFTNSVTRGSCLKLVKPTCSSDIRKYFFISRVIDVWNCLNNDIVNSPSIDQLTSPKVDIITK